MARYKLIFELVVAVVVAFAPTAQAATNVLFVGAGSSAMWQQFGLSTYNSVCNGGGSGSSACSHYTVKGRNGSNNYSQLFDQRSSSIPVETGSLWIVWGPDVKVPTDTDVWAYLTVDSAVGVRCYFATPRCLVQLDSSTQTTPGQNLMSSALFNGNTTDVSGLPFNIFTALNGKTVSAGLTPIRPEDQKFAFTRAVSVLNSTTYAGLGYGTGTSTLVGTPILGAAVYQGSSVTPVAFNLTGKDPFTALTIPSSTTISVGAAPILFYVNRTTGGAIAGAAPQNLTSFGAQRIFNGTDCATSALDSITNGAASGPIHVIELEPIGGTATTAELTVFRTASQPNNSQEKGVNPAVDNPLLQNCLHGGGDRGRAIGTGNGVKSVKATTDSLSYIFFSYGNVSSIANNPNYGYLKLDGVDPIFTSYNGTASGFDANQNTSTTVLGQLPGCAGPCPVAPNTSFPNLRNGAYRSWSIYRVVTDKTGANNINAAAIVKAAQASINQNIPDFVPSNAQADGDLGLTVFRSHYGTGAHNGINTPAEAGQDAGGAIFQRADEQAIAGDTVKEILNVKQ
jgi:hypothetical protein